MSRPPPRILILGALGGVGQGLVSAFLERPSGEIGELVIVSRDAARLERFRETLRTPVRISTAAGDVGTTADANRLRDAVLAGGPVDVVIASLGGWWSAGPLTEIDDATWHDVMNELVTGHAVSARSFVPVMTSPGARYLLIGGGAALRPVPGSSLVSIAGAAQLMLTRALVAERADDVPPRIHELVIDGPIATDAAHHGPKTPNEITAREVGRAVAAWCLDTTATPRFAWPDELLSHDGPVTVMRQR